MATETGSAGATIASPADVGLKREMGFIGAVWASESSIIGSGWLFGALYAAQAAGPAAIIAWVIGGVAVVILALIHAELGAMYPVSGGTARFPHFGFGALAGMSFGFFSWLQAVTVAPIECFAVMNYGSHWWPALYNSTGERHQHRLHHVRRLDDPLHRAELRRHQVAVEHQQRAHVVEDRDPGAHHRRPALQVPQRQLRLVLGSGGFMPTGIKGVLSAVVGAGVVFSYLGFEQADQLAGEIKNAQRNLPRAIITAVAIGTAIYILLQIVFIAAMDPSVLTFSHGWTGLACPATGTCNANVATINSGPFAGLAGIIGLSWLAFILRLDAIISPFGTGLIYQTSGSRVSYGLGRNRYFPPILTKTDSRGVPWVSLILSFIGGLVFLLPFPSWHALVGLVTGASVLMYAGAPLSLAAFRKQVPEAVRPYRLAAASVWAPARVHHRQLHHLLVRLHRDLEARHLHRRRLRHHRNLHDLRPAATEGVLREVPQVGELAAGLPDRHGRHLVARPVQRAVHVDPAGAHQHQHHRPVVRPADHRGVQPRHLLLGGCRQAAS